MYRSSATGGIAGGIVLIGLALAFLIGGGFNLPIFFVALAFASLVGSMSSRNPQGIYGGLQGFFWLMALAVFFITNSWIVFLFAAGISAILGTLARPIMAGLGSMAFFGMTQKQPQPQYYQPPQQPYQPPQQPYQPYQEGYQPPHLSPKPTRKADSTIRILPKHHSSMSNHKRNIHSKCRHNNNLKQAISKKNREQRSYFHGGKRTTDVIPTLSRLWARW